MGLFAHGNSHEEGAGAAGPRCWPLPPRCHGNPSDRLSDEVHRFLDAVRAE
ncbi:hypothetical protein ACLBX9_23230 [Methylobacterium sp. A49B]|uniref:hypothetical protein n=1 Tax=Methylobacterium mesophilicum TaxID=39956 RepID=UPI0002C601D9|nr:hypothetical protein [Methylobacterium mesophilicum]